VKILANENFPQAAVLALQGAGHDVLWARKEMPGASDENVMARAAAEQRLLVTFDMDFGELVYRRGLPPACGVVLFRLAIPSPDLAADRTLAVLQSRTDWGGQFAVVEETRVRLRPLPAGHRPDR
jgi:predicted nuclease of predicted toxin-antitoxin system